MKKKMLLLLVSLFPIFAYAEDSCPIIRDTSTSLERILSCDGERMTTTTYKSKEDAVVLDNSVCKITCSEELTFSIDPIKKVLAGTSFNYPLYVSGERKCTASYNAKSYEDTIKKLVNEYNTLQEGNAKTTKGNELTNYYSQKKECDEFTKVDSDNGKKYKYDLDADVSLSIATSESTQKINYSYREISNYKSNVNKTETVYDSCNYNENEKKCDNSEKTISSWTETVRIFGKYTMPDTYVESYTGEILNKASAEGKNACNAGDRYFTSFTEFTKPIDDEKGYELTLVAKNIKKYSANENWNLTTNCSYEINNLFTPQTSDENYSKYGSQAFSYRTIALNDPFPNNREKGANWSYLGVDKIDKIINNNMTSNEFYVSLNSSNIARIREYNRDHSYNAFNFEYNETKGGYYSSFIEKNPSFIERNRAQ